MKNLTLKEIISNMNEALEGSDIQYLHGGKDEEGGMALSQLHRIIDISQQLSDSLKPETQLPAWIQSHITTAYENLTQVSSYLEPKMHGKK